MYNPCLRLPYHVCQLHVYSDNLSDISGPTHLKKSGASGCPVGPPGAMRKMVQQDLARLPVLRVVGSQYTIRQLGIAAHAPTPDWHRIFSERADGLSVQNLIAQLAVNADRKRPPAPILHIFVMRPCSHLLQRLSCNLPRDLGQPFQLRARKTETLAFSRPPTTGCPWWRVHWQLPRDPMRY